METAHKSFKRQKSKVRWTASFGLSSIEREKASENVFETVLEALNEGDEDIQFNAITSLGDLGSRAFVHLIKILSCDNIELKSNAISSLGYLKDRRAFEPLIGFLKDNNVIIRGSAALALGNLGIENAIKYLIDAFKDEDPNVRDNVISGLGELKNYKMQKFIYEALKDEDLNVRRRASEVLDYWNWKPKNDLERVYLFIGKNESSSEDLEKIDEKIFINVLKDMNSEGRWSILNSLANIKTNKAGNIILLLLKDSDFNIRSDIMQIIENIEYDDKYKKSLLKIFIQSLHDPNCFIRESSVINIGNLYNNDINDDIVINSLISTLKDEDYDVRVRAAETLEKYKWEPKNNFELTDYLVAKNENLNENLKELDIESLIRILNDEFTDIQSLVIEILGNTNDKNVIKPLIKTLKDDDYYVRKESAIALGKIQDFKAIDPLINALDDDEFIVREQCMKSLVKLGNISIRPLIKNLKNKNPAIRDRIVWTLGCIGDKEAIEAVYSVLNDIDVRRRAIFILGKMQFKKALNPLIQALKDDDYNIQLEAVIALGEMGDKKAVKPLLNSYFCAGYFIKPYALKSLIQIGDMTEFIEGLQDKDFKTRKDSAYILGIVKDKNAVMPLINSLHDSHRFVRGTAALALSEIGDKKAIPSLIKSLNDNSTYVRIRVVRALENFKNGTYKILINCLNDNNGDVRAEAIHALGRIKNKSSLNNLILALKDDQPFVRESAADALGEIGDNRASDYLTEALKDSDNYVRFNAAVALVKIGSDKNIELTSNILLEGLRNDDEENRWTAAFMLSKIDCKEELNLIYEILLKALNEGGSYYKEEAINGLGEIGDLRAVEILKKTESEDNREHIREKARNAIKRIQY